MRQTIIRFYGSAWTFGFYYLFTTMVTNNQLFCERECLLLLNVVIYFRLGRKKNKSEKSLGFTNFEGETL